MNKTIKNQALLDSIIKLGKKNKIALQNCKKDDTFDIALMFSSMKDAELITPKVDKKINYIFD